jgi:ectoine hydroxylase-related dioxygenase (phytanoyl-CoA dioxygenase family)
MLDIDLLDASETQRAAKIFHRDGFVAIKNALTPEQLAFARKGAERVIKEQLDADPERKGNRGNHRYSFGPQHHHPEWAMLIDLPHILKIVETIWGSPNFNCSGAGGDYSLPGAKMQPLHKDMGDYFQDPSGQVTFHDTVAPFIVVNFLMVDFNKTNGGTRFVPCTQRHRGPIPTVEEEPRWMQNQIIHAPAGTALVRDVRCWHGGPPNDSDIIRPMTSVGYFAPWFHGGFKRSMPRAVYNTLSPRAKELSRFIVLDE